MWKGLAPHRAMRRGADGIKKVTNQARARLRSIWQAHRERLATDATYGAAFAAAVLAACELVTKDPRLLALWAALTRLYVSVSRTVHPPWEATDDWL